MSLNLPGKRGQFLEFDVTETLFMYLDIVGSHHHDRLHHAILPAAQPVHRQTFDERAYAILSTSPPKQVLKVEQHFKKHLS
jgi:hypothetical protein